MNAGFLQTTNCCMFGICARFAGMCARVAGICARFAGMFRMFPRNRHEKREAAARAKHARIKMCARSPEKRPTGQFLLRNTKTKHKVM